MWGGMAMTTAPGGELVAPGHKLQSASPRPGTAGAAAALLRPRLAVVTLPGEIDASNDGQIQDTLTSALDDGTAVLVADAAATAFCGCSGVTALLLAHHRAAAAGAQLRVVVGSPPAADTGTDRRRSGTQHLPHPHRRARRRADTPPIMTHYPGAAERSLNK